MISKKILSIGLSALMLSSVAAPAMVYADEAPLKVGTLKGPTAMGMAQLMEDGKYEFTIAKAPDEIVPQILKGDVDVAAVPANMASILYAKSKKDISVLAINTLGVLYLVQNGDTIKSVEDLKGKTIYLSGKGATPEYALKYILKENGIDPEKDVKLEFKSEHTEVLQELAKNKDAIGLLPQPFVTVATTKNANLKVALDLNKLWLEATKKAGKEAPLVTGAVVAKTSFIKDHTEEIHNFLEAYKKSVEFVNNDVDKASEIIGKKDIVPAPIAKKAIPACNIVFIDGKEMKEDLESYYNILKEQNPKTIGGQLPDEGFYYQQ